MWSGAIRSYRRLNNGAANAQETTRDNLPQLDGGPGKAPLLSVLGGKITTYRVLAEDALGKLASLFPGWAKGAGSTLTIVTAALSSRRPSYCVQSLLKSKTILASPCTALVMAVANGNSFSALSI
ncbi:glycerol-3-phosphate dehydrogenase [Rhizobium leguminosarum]|uniref:hypothetical protein n=1 Tax=Rhizobium TaxID=379 RepID=UPI0018324835|nr:hypothetical protein [Rhizobium leguminosarum]MBB4420754.1 glycerol-3-phosphate dehydrogenase [Rhizobium leguminosarum]